MAKKKKGKGKGRLLSAASCSSLFSTDSVSNADDGPQPSASAPAVASVAASHSDLADGGAGSDLAPFTHLTGPGRDISPVPTCGLCAANLSPGSDTRNCFLCDGRCHFTCAVNSPDPKLKNTDNLALLSQVLSGSLFSYICPDCATSQCVAKPVSLGTSVSSSSPTHESSSNSDDPTASDSSSDSDSDSCSGIELLSSTDLAARCSASRRLAGRLTRGIVEDAASAMEGFLSSWANEKLPALVKSAVDDATSNLHRSTDTSPSPPNPPQPRKALPSLFSRRFQPPFPIHIPQPMPFGSGGQKNTTPLSQKITAQGQKTMAPYPSAPHSPIVMPFFGKMCFMSNFYPSPFIVAELSFPDVETFYQYRKASLFGCWNLAKRILTCGSPAQAKQLGSQTRMSSQRTWRLLCDKVMKEGIEAKFRQNDILRAKLQATSTNILVEASVDRYWGSGIRLHGSAGFYPATWPGLNRLGTLLMDLRVVIGPASSANNVRPIPRSSSTLRCSVLDRARLPDRYNNPSATTASRTQSDYRAKPIHPTRTASQCPVSENSEPGRINKRDRPISPSATPDCSSTLVIKGLCDNPGTDTAHLLKCLFEQCNLDLSVAHVTWQRFGRHPRPNVQRPVKVVFPTRLHADAFFALAPLLRHHGDFSSVFVERVLDPRRRQLAAWDRRATRASNLAQDGYCYSTSRNTSRPTRGQIVESVFVRDREWTKPPLYPNF